MILGRVKELYNLLTVAVDEQIALSRSGVPAGHPSQRWVPTCRAVMEMDTPRPRLRTASNATESPVTESP